MIQLLVWPLVRDGCSTSTTFPQKKRGMCVTLSRLTIPSIRKAKNMRTRFFLFIILLATLAIPTSANKGSSAQASDEFEGPDPDCPCAVAPYKDKWEDGDTCEAEWNNFTQNPCIECCHAEHGGANCVDPEYSGYDVEWSVLELCFDDGRRLSSVRKNLTVNDVFLTKNGEILWEKRFGSCEDLQWKHTFFMKIKGNFYAYDINGDDYPEVAIAPYDEGNNGVRFVQIYTVYEDHLELYTEKEFNIFGNRPLYKQ